MYSTCSPAACTNNENSQHSQARADNRNRHVPVLLGVVGGVVHDVVGEDHRGEDRVATDKTGAERVGRGRGVRGLHSHSAVIKGAAMRCVSADVREPRPCVKAGGILSTQCPAGMPNPVRRT